MTKAFLIASAATALLMAGSASAQDTASGDLKNAKGETIGKVTVTEAPKGVILRIEAKGVAPGWHGLHFHETGDCSKSDFTSAGGHVHGGGTLVHGLLNPEANDSGDLPNVGVGAGGEILAEAFSPLVSLKGAGGRPALLDANGSAVVVHASPDDYKSQPIGGAGARIACAVIK